MAKRITATPIGASIRTTTIEPGHDQKPKVAIVGAGIGGCILARVFDGDASGDAPAMLKLYEDLRKPRGSRCQLASRERAKEYHMSSPGARFWRDVKLVLRNKFGTDKTPLRAGWVYDYDPAVSPLHK